MLFSRTVREELLFGPRNLGRDRPRPSTRSSTTSSAGPSLDDARGHPRAAAADAVVRPAEAARPRDRARPRAARPDPRRAVSRPGSPDGEPLPRRGRNHPEPREPLPVTHDVDLALTHADRILLMRDGVVVADGPPSVVIADEESWIACNLRLTSLLRANAQWRARAGSAPRRGGTCPADRGIGARGRLNGGSTPRAADRWGALTTVGGTQWQR